MCVPTLIHAVQWGNHSAYGSVYQARWLTTSGAGVSVDPRNLLMIVR